LNFDPIVGQPKPLFGSG
jgi:hypothetical protein